MKIRVTSYCEDNITPLLTKHQIKTLHTEFERKHKATLRAKENAKSIEMVMNEICGEEGKYVCEVSNSNIATVILPFPLKPIRFNNEYVSPIENVELTAIIPWRKNTDILKDTIQTLMKNECFF